MIKEVEIFNNVESIKTGTLYPPYVTDTNINMLTGYVTEGGNLLTVDINRELAAGYVRFVYLWYAVVDLDERVVSYTLLDTQDVVSSSTGDKGSPVTLEASSHNFDISSVMTIPRKINVAPRIKEVNIDLFTYEANITDAAGNAIYGTKRLSVPFSSSLDGNYDLATSTDGWYVLGVVDYKARDLNYAYSDTVEIGDIVYWFTGDGQGNSPTLAQLETGALYTAVVKTALSPETEGKWTEVTEADQLRLVNIPHSPELGESAAVIGADILITRYLKQEVIYDLLIRGSFREYDDQRARDFLSRISAMREKAVLKLSKGYQIDAYNLLEQAKVLYDQYVNTDREAIYSKLTAKYSL